MARTPDKVMEERRELVLRYLLEGSQRGRSAVVSYSRMRQDLGLTQCELRCALDGLKDRSLVEAAPRFGSDGGQIASAYRVTEAGRSLARSHERAAPAVGKRERKDRPPRARKKKGGRLSLPCVRAFVDAYEAGSISGAAQTERTSVANASKAIITLEEDLGARLFERTGQGVRPTAVGELFYRKAAAAVRAFAECEGFADRLGSVRAAADKAAGA